MRVESYQVLGWEQGFYLRLLVVFKPSFFSRLLGEGGWTDEYLGSGTVWSRRVRGPVEWVRCGTLVEAALSDIYFTERMKMHKGT
jgi:hypothetical protein